MPITKSAIKHLRQSEKRRKTNRALKEHLKSSLKEFRKLASDKKTDELKTKCASIYSLIDKAVKKGLLHKNTAARKKSKIAHLLHQTNIPQI